MTIRILDGIRNILPYGVDYAFQNEYSNLLTAYRRMSFFRRAGWLLPLSSVPSDTAEPSRGDKGNSGSVSRHRCTIASILSLGQAA
ncbi:MAG: hypothetical protein R2758_11000 [Bacteroidales bacterium]